MDIQLLGHRGSRGERFENSRQGFDYVQHLSSLSNGKLVGIEFDVQLTKDKQLVVFHDETLSRLYRHQSRINQLTYQEIQKLSADTHPILLLNDITPMLDGYTHVELEIKTHERTNYRLLIEALEDALNHKLPNSVTVTSNIAPSSITLTTFDITLHQLLQTHPLLSLMPRGLLVQPLNPKLYLANTKAKNSVKGSLKTNVYEATTLYDIPYTAMRLGCTRIGLYHDMYDSRFILLCRNFDINTSAWTVNEVIQVKRLSSMGVNHIITDYPAMMLSVL